MVYNCKEDIIALTAEWKGERLEDGRPKVPSEVLDRLRSITFEEGWGLLWRNDYKFCYETGMKAVKRPEAGKNLVGRAVTSVWVPSRPDLRDILLEVGHNQGFKGNFNQWIIDNLQEDDVAVVDMFDKVFQGTFVGGNLSTAIRNRTQRGGLVCWGGVRDLEQIVGIDGLQMYIRGADPTGIADVVMTGYNVPTRIGRAVCLPGDVVVGTLTGVLFIPAQYAEQVADAAERSMLRDKFGFMRLAEGTYTSAQIDGAWDDPIIEDFLNWFKTSDETEKYRYLDWTEEFQKMRERREEMRKRMAEAAAARAAR